MRDASGAEDLAQADEQVPLRKQKVEKSSFIKKLFSFLRSREAPSSDNEALAKSINEGTLSAQQRSMFENIAQLHTARVGDVMISRSEIEAIDIDTTLAETLEVFEKSGHSRLPVYAETLDDPRGMIHIRDLLNCITRNARKSDGTLDLARVDLTKTVGELDVIREVLFVPDSMLASQLLTRMQTTRTQMALVIDEYGGTDGLASMEDVFELVVGDIEDEHDDDEVVIVQEAPDSWLVDGRAEIEEIEEAIGPNFAVGELGEDVDTIGGLIVSEIDRIPTRSEVIEVIPGYRFQILDADRRRIRRLRIKRISDNTKATSRQH